MEVIGVELSKDNPYDLYDSHGELLSGTTEDIDTGKLVANQLSSDKQAEYLDKFKSEIKESAINYYKTIFSSMDSEVKVTIEFYRIIFEIQNPGHLWSGFCVVL